MARCLISASQSRNRAWCFSRKRISRIWFRACTSPSPSSDSFDSSVNRWYPTSERKGADTSPRCSRRMAASISGASSPRLSEPSAPPSFPDPSSEYFRAISAKSASPSSRA
ncbi:MAG TPA: hypothetical protein DCQ64_19220 [Candidatus Rokubacteria bacterium]|nr:hypothetical protein [Candidatus Rokubacteria bacterium]